MVRPCFVVDGKHARNLFFNYPTSVARLIVFMIWMRESVRTAIKVVIMFHIGTKTMIKAAIQLTENPNQRLFVDLSDTLITRKIERLFKGPKFSLAHPRTSDNAPSLFTKQILNLNYSSSSGSF